MHVCKHVGMCICILLFAGNTYLSSHATWHQQRGQARLAPPSHGRSKTPPLIENLLWVGSWPTKQLISLEVSALGCRQSLNAVPAPSRDPSLKQGDLAAELKKKGCQETFISGEGISTFRKGIPGTNPKAAHRAHQMQLVAIRGRRSPHAGSQGVCPGWWCLYSLECLAGRYNT